MAPLSFFESSSLLLLFVVLYQAYWQLTTGAARRRMIQKHGCKPVRRVEDNFVDRIFSKKAIAAVMSDAKRGKLLEHLQARYARIGYTHAARVFHRDWIYTVEAENLKTFLATNFKQYSMPDKRKSAFVPLLGHGIFTTDGAQWHASRELLRPNFVKSQVGDLDTFEEHVGHLMKAIPRDGKTVVNLQELFFRLTMDSSTEFLFGSSTNTLLRTGTDEQNIDTKFAAAFERSQNQVMASLRSGFLDISLPKQFKEDVKLIHSYVDRYVERGLQLRKAYADDPEKAEAESNNGRYVFLNELVRRIGDPVRIRTELLAILLAGRDTTASLLGNMWFMLARKPEVWKKLQDEVDSLGGQIPTFEQLKNMKYLKACMNESLRLHPVIPLNSRMAIVDTVLPVGGGPDGQSPLFIPKGQIVSYSVYTMHRRKDYFGEDADQYNPDRWESLRPGWEFLPFNGGPRICIGQQYALAEASYATIRVMQKFKDIQPADERPWVEQITLTCCNRNGAKVVLTPR